jgi:aminopeptidase
MKKIIVTSIFLILNFSLFSQINSSVQSPVEKFADVLVNYSLQVKPKEHVLITTSFQAKELNLEVFKQIIKAGAYVTFQYNDDDFGEIFYKYANEDQLNKANDGAIYSLKNADVLLMIESSSNLKNLSNADPEKIKKHSVANKEFGEIRREKEEKNQQRWCYTVFPNPIHAQEAGMGTSAYKEFVFNSCKLYDNDPVASWAKTSVEMKKWINWLNGKKQIALKGTNIDLSMSVDGRKFVPCDGRYNFPDGEIFCSPVENSVNGWVKFSNPVIIYEKEVIDLKLWFEKGKVVKHEASKGNELVSALLETDEGVKFLGEFGIGTNYEITQVTNHMLFDEKIGGTIHLALGQGFPESGGINNSIIHLDMLCDMKTSQILVDGELFYENGKFVK